MATSTITIISGASTVTLDNTVSTITLGTSGPQGAPGEGVPVGGTAGQILAKDTATDYDTSWIDNYTTDVRKWIKNDSGGTLAKGTVVYVSGANGTNVLVKPALATTDGTSATTIGFLNESLANNGQGYAIVEGTISGIDTSAATAGDPVWLSGAVAGGVLYGVANKPQAPVHIVYLGTVTRAHATQGSIEISVNNGWELDELHNVKITSPANGQVLTYDSTQSLWVNSSETGDISAVNVTAPITGGGTSGAVTIGIDQTALSVTASQISDGATTFARLGSANAFTVGGHTIVNSGATTVIPLAITAASGQTGSLTQWKNSSGTLLSQITAAGNLAFGTGESNTRFASDGRAFIYPTNTGSAQSLHVTTAAAASKGIVVVGAASQTANLQEWQDSAGTVGFRVKSNPQTVGFDSATTARIDVGSVSTMTYNASTGWLFTPYSASSIGMVIKGAAAMTANLQEWQNSAGTVLARMLAGGGFYAAFLNTTNSQSSLSEENSGGAMRLKVQTAAAANPGSGFGKLYFRDGTTAGTLKLVVRAGTAGAETTILDNIPQ